MATYIDLDSRHRNWQVYTNPAYFVVEAEQVSTWNRAPRQVTAQSSRLGSRVVEFSQSVKLKQLIIPYVDNTLAGYYNSGTSVVTGAHSATFQRLYVDVHTARYDDKQLIYTINNKIPKARFACTQEGFQFDDTNTPRWIKFGSNMDQVMRFARNESLVFEIMQEDGNRVWFYDNPQDAPPTAPVPTYQVWALLEVTPYFRDSDYNNHGIGLTQF